jgi:hypothetical protein
MVLTSIGMEAPPGRRESGDSTAAVPEPRGQTRWAR